MPASKMEDMSVNNISHHCLLNQILIISLESNWQCIYGYMYSVHNKLQWFVI